MENNNSVIKTNENITCSIVHIFGLLISSFIFILMLEIANVFGNIKGYVLIYSFSITVILYYLTSIVYHFLSEKKESKAVAILHFTNASFFFLTIPATLSTICLLDSSGIKGTVILIISIVFSVAAIVFTIVKGLAKSKIISFIFVLLAEIPLYFFSISIVKNISWVCLLLLGIGTVLKIVGLLFYGSRKTFTHVFWHIFFVFAESLQSLSIMTFILPKLFNVQV